VARYSTREPAYTPGGPADPFRDTDLNGHILALVDAADRPRGHLTATEALHSELRRAFQTFPRPCWQQARLLECVRQLGIDTDTARQLWRTRDEP
jgi:hypothetical protein